MNLQKQVADFFKIPGETQTDEWMKPGFVKKIIQMFRPATHGLGPYSKSDLIQGPNDRAVIGYDTFFCKDWLVEDYNFTEEEAWLFIELVKRFSNQEAGDE